MVHTEWGMWILSIIVLVYVASGGPRAVAYVDTLQCIMLAVGIVIVGLIAYDIAGGRDSLNAGLSKKADPPDGKGCTTKGYVRRHRAEVVHGGKKWGSARYVG